MDLARGLSFKNSKLFMNEITVNWKFLDFETSGHFYTDANAYKMVKRNVTLLKEQSKSVASYFFPVSSAIFVEDIL